MRSRTAVLVLAFGLFAGSAFAQTTQGRLTGLITDAQGAILPGVTVTVTSPALIGVQSTVTQPDGRFLFPALPTGAAGLEDPAARDAEGVQHDGGRSHAGIGCDVPLGRPQRRPRPARHAAEPGRGLLPGRPECSHPGLT